MTRLKLALFAFFSAAALSGCPNLFDPIDNPSGDAQLLSAARACFDDQDYECAREYYGRLGGDTSNSELAFMILDQENLGTDALIVAVAGGTGSSVGEILNRLVEKAARENAGATKRAALLTAYNKLALISNAEIQGFVQFVVALTLAAELMAEQTGVLADNIFHKVDFAASAACTVGGGACAANAGCDAAAGGLASGTATDGDDLNVSGNYGTVGVAGVPASVESFHQALDAAGAGLTNMGVATGSTFTLIDEITSNGTPSTSAAVARCYRAAMLDLGVGR